MCYNKGEASDLRLQIEQQLVNSLEEGAFLTYFHVDSIIKKAVQSVLMSL